MSTVAERNARLDALADATTKWAERRTTELKNKLATVKKVLRGRTGSERLAAATSEAASDLVVREIDDFLTTE